MRFHRALEEIAGSAERVRVLRVLALFGKEYTSSELAGYAGVSARGAIDILTVFEKAGLVRSRRVGHSIIWKLDGNNHLALSLVRPMFEAESGLMERLKGEISGGLQGMPVRSAVIYGSVARGEERPDSDIDLLLVVSRKGRWLDEVQDRLRAAVLRLFGNQLSILVCTPGELRNLPAGLREDVKSGIVVVGG